MASHSTKTMRLACLWLLLAFTLPIAANAQENETAVIETPGFYIAATLNRGSISNRTSGQDAETDGSNAGFSVGYRINENWRVEYQRATIEYDDTRAGLPSVAVTDIEGDYKMAAILYQERSGDWLPFIGFARAEVELTETHEALEGEIFNRAGGTIVTKDDGWVFLVGLDYPFMERLHLRADLTIFNTDYLQSHDVIRIGSVFHF